MINIVTPRHPRNFRNYQNCSTIMACFVLTTCYTTRFTTCCRICFTTCYTTHFTTCHSTRFTSCYSTCSTTCLGFENTDSQPRPLIRLSIGELVRTLKYLFNRTRIRVFSNSFTCDFRESLQYETLSAPISLSFTIIFSHHVLGFFFHGSTVLTKCLHSQNTCYSKNFPTLPSATPTTFSIWTHPTTLE